MRPWTIYAVRAGEWLKVGRTRNLSSRIAALQCGCPLPMELVFERETSSKFRETVVHDALRDAGLHHCGEWFTHSEEALAIIAAYV